MATSNNYTARIRTKLDSADLQKQIDKIVEKSKSIKIEVKMDTNIQKSLDDITSKVNNANKSIDIKANVDTKQAENGLDVLQKRIISLGKDGEKSIQEISRAMGKTFDTITSTVDGVPKKITEDYASVAKRVEQENKKIQALESQINEEMEKTKSILSQMNSESSMRYQLEQKLSELSKKGTSKEKLADLQALTAETSDWAKISEKVLETQQKITQEQRQQEANQASASNKNKERDLALEKQINAEIEKTRLILSQMNSESSMRYQLEQRLATLETKGTSQEKLSAAKSLTAETRDWAEVSKRVLETQQKITQEQREQEKAQASAINKNAEKQLAMNQKIDEELQKVQTRMSEININAKKRAELEEQIAKATAMQNDEKKLQALKNINTQITAMGKNAMSLGAMLQTAYEKFANNIATLYRNVY